MNTKAIYMLAAIAAVLVLGGGTLYMIQQPAMVGAAGVGPTRLASAQPTPSAGEAQVAGCTVHEEHLQPCADCLESAAATSSCHTCPDAQAPDPAGEQDGQRAAQGKTLSVDADKCVGCGKCVRLAPGVFELDAVTQKARVADPNAADRETIDRAMSHCPTGAIEWK